MSSKIVPAEPRGNFYPGLPGSVATPPDYRGPKLDLHYVLVQVNGNRFAVCEYDGKADGFLTFRTVSDGLNLNKAEELAKLLRSRRPDDPRETP